MRKIFLLLLLVPLMTIAQDKFVISGNIQGLPEGSAITVVDVNAPNDVLAKGTAKNGSFELKGSVKEPNLLQVNFDGLQKKSVIFIGNDKVKINGTAEALQEASVKGSAVHDDFEYFKSVFNPLFAHLGELGQRINSAATRNDSLANAYANQIENIETQIDAFIEKYSASPVAPFLLMVTKGLDQDISVLERRYSLLNKKVQNGFYGKLINDELMTSKAGAVGTEAIDFSQADTEGKMVSLSSFRGKYVLVDFWASWCRPCRDENPNLVKAFDKYKDKNFTVLGVSLDRDKDAWLRAIKADHLQWTQVSDLKFWNNEVAVKYKIQSIPQNILIDPNGKIIAKNLRGFELHDTLGKLLK